MKSPRPPKQPVRKPVQKESKSFFSPNKELTEVIVALHKWLSANLNSVTKLDLKNEVKKLETKLMATQQETAAALKAANQKLTKVGGEIDDVKTVVETLKERVTTLEEALAAAPGETAPEVTEAVNGINDTINLLDEKLPDKIVPPDGSGGGTPV